MGVYRLRKYVRASEWVTCKAKIQKCREAYKEVPQALTTTKYYFPLVTYEYFFNNHVYTSTLVSPHIRNIWVCEVNNWGDITPEDNKFWNTWKSGQEIDISVDPNNPSESYVVKELSTPHRSHNYALILSGILIFIFWFFLAIKT